jgi:hypothetical protein
LKVSIAKLHNREISNFMRFMESSPDNWAIFREMWLWRQQGKPESGGEEAVVAKIGNSIVGCVGIVPVNLTINGDKVDACWQQDSLVGPNLRGQGLGKRLVKEAEKGYQLIMAKGSSQGMYRLRKSSGYSDVSNSDHLVRVLKPVFTKCQIKKSLIEYCFWAYGSMVPLQKDNTALTVESVDHFGEEFDNLAVALSTTNVVRPYKSSAYLNWRYFRCPIKSYTIFQAFGSRLRGAIIINISKKDLNDGWIVDMLHRPGDTICANTLLNQAMRFFNENQVRRIFTFTTLPATRKCFFRHGFLPTGQTPRFTYRYPEYNSDVKSLAGLDWDFWQGDGDLDLYL